MNTALTQREETALVLWFERIRMTLDHQRRLYDAGNADADDELGPRDFLVAAIDTTQEQGGN